MQNLIESALFHPCTISKYLKENNSRDLVNKLCIMSHLYETCESDKIIDKMMYVEKHFPIVYDTLEKYESYKTRLGDIINTLTEEDGAVPTNTVSGIDASTPRIYPKKKKIEDK